MGTKKYRWLSIVFSFIFVITTTSSPAFFASSSVFASIDPDRELPPPEVEVVNPYFTLERFTLDDGTTLEKSIINGPPEPPPGYEDARTASIQPLPSRGVINNFPSYDWVFGCSAVSGAMIAAYYDNNGYPDIYTGPTNGGVMPLTDTSWTSWDDGYDTYPNNPLIASKNGVDGRSIKGSIDDYWVRYNSAASDPYITGGWPQHAWSDAIGDYMKTSQSTYGNTDGSTWFYNNPSSPLTCDSMEVSYDDDKNVWVDDVDGTYGRKLFYEARGYSVGDCYNEYTDNIGGGFTLSDFQAEINLGHPVLLNLAGHSIVGYGYSGSTIYIRDTWSSDPSFTPTMTWGDSYYGMALQSVSVVRLVPLAAPPSPPTGVSASDGTYTDKVRITWSPSAGADDYKVFQNTTNSSAGAAELVSGHSASPYDDYSAAPGLTYYYWVKACNSAGCSSYSAYDSGWRTESSIYLPMILNGAGTPGSVLINGDFEQGYVGWTEYSSGGLELIYGDVSWAHSGSWLAYLGGFDNAVDQLYQDVTITASEPYINFWGIIKTLKNNTRKFKNLIGFC